MRELVLILGAPRSTFPYYCAYISVALLVDVLVRQAKAWGGPPRCAREDAIARCLRQASVQPQGLAESASRCRPCVRVHRVKVVAFHRRLHHHLHFDHLYYNLHHIFLQDGIDEDCFQKSL